MRKSSPSFCQDTPDKESRCHWEVIMIVLTDGKDASSAYCLTTALYCPLPGQYLAIARHKTIRREKKNPHSLFYSSPFTKSSETPINTGVPRGEELASPFTTLHHSSPSDCARNWNGSLTCSVGGLKTLFYVPQISQIYTDFSGWRVGEEWWRGERTLHPIKATYTQQLTPLRWRVKSIFETGGLSLQVTAKSV